MGIVYTRLLPGRGSNMDGELTQPRREDLPGELGPGTAASSPTKLPPNAIVSKGLPEKLEPGIAPSENSSRAQPSSPPVNRPWVALNVFLLLVFSIELFAVGQAYLPRRPQIPVGLAPAVSIWAFIIGLLFGVFKGERDQLLRRLATRRGSAVALGFPTTCL